MKEILVCDDCYEKVTGLLPDCTDYCNLDLSHDGACDERERAGRQVKCFICGSESRLQAIEDQS